jgi:hypothetical protein
LYTDCNRLETEFPLKGALYETHDRKPFSFENALKLACINVAIQKISQGGPGLHASREEERELRGVEGKRWNRKEGWEGKKGR